MQLLLEMLDAAFLRNAASLIDFASFWDAAFFRNLGSLSYVASLRDAGSSFYKLL